MDADELTMVLDVPVMFTSLAELTVAIFGESIVAAFVPLMFTLSLLSTVANVSADTVMFTPRKWMSPSLVIVSEELPVLSEMLLFADTETVPDPSKQTELFAASVMAVSYTHLTLPTTSRV